MRVVLSLLLAFACAPAAAAAQSDPTADYRGYVRVDPAARTIAGDVAITFQPDSSERDSVRLLLNSGYDDVEVSGPRVVSHSVDTAGALIVRFSPRLDAGQTTVVRVRYAGTPVFGGDNINGVGASWVELGLDSDWHPVFDDYRHRVTGVVAVDGLAGWTVVSSAEVAPTPTGAVLRFGVPLLDLPFAAAPSLLARESDDAIVYYAPGTSVEQADAVLATATRCASWLNERYGEREPLPRARLVLPARTGPGYARKHYIALSSVEGLAPAQLGHFICHELAHFWSSRASSMSADNWLNEGIAEYVAGRFVASEFGAEAHAPLLARWAEAAGDPVAIWTPTATARPGPRVSYRKAPHAMHLLEQRVGADTMDRILAAYMTQPIVSTPQLLAEIDRIAGAETGQWFRELLARTRAG